MAIPVSLQGSNGGEWLTGKTVTVSKFGALLVLRNPTPMLACGDSVAIALQRARQSRTGRVVWIDRSNAAHCAVEIERPRDFWGVYFPGSAEEVVVLPVPEVETVSREPAPTLAEVFPAPAKLPFPAMTQSAPLMGGARPKVPPNGLVALLSGISAVYNGFTERMEVVDSAPDELTGLLATPLKPGTRVRVIVNSRLLYGRVLGVSGQRVEGKSRVRLKILESAEHP